MNDDINIYDGRQIEGTSESKSRSNWQEMFEMIGNLFFENFILCNRLSLHFTSFKYFKTKERML